MAKAAKNTPPANEEPKDKSSFNLKVTILRKLKYISAVDDRFQGDLVEEALEKYITDWEKKNGEIKLK